MTPPPSSASRPAPDDPLQRRKAANPRPLVRLWPFLMRHRIMSLAALLALLAAAAATLAVPVAVRRMIDIGLSHDDIPLLHRYFSVMMILGALLALASAARFFCVSWLGERIAADLRNAVYHHLTTLSPAFFEEIRTGEILSRLTADTTLVKTIAASGLAIALRNLILFIGAAAMMAVTSTRLTAMVLLALPVIIVPVVASGRIVRRLSRQSQDRIADTGAHAAETIANIGTLQSFNRERTDRAAFTAAVERAFSTANRRIAARSLLTALVIALAFSSVIAVLWAGAIDVLDGTMSSGQLGQFILYAVLAATAMAALSETWGDTQLAAGATERLMEILDAAPQITAPDNPLPMPQPPLGRVAFSNVTFAYPSRPTQPALNGVSLNIEPGQTVALVGPSGAGKTTLFQLLQRFHDPLEGGVRLDGIDLRHADPHDVRARLGVVAQEPILFAMSIADNIRYGRPDASDEAVRAAAKTALADQFIRHLPDQYDTRLAERAVTLSGGQRQQIAIARALLRDPCVLLLDEATSALDAEGDRLVRQALEELMANRTTLVIAHRLTTVLRADRIVVLDRGSIVASGTHAELIRDGGLYARLAALQFDPEKSGPEKSGPEKSGEEVLTAPSV